MVLVWWKSDHVLPRNPAPCLIWKLLISVDLAAVFGKCEWHYELTLTSLEAGWSLVMDNMVMARQRICSSLPTSLKMWCEHDMAETLKFMLEMLKAKIKMQSMVARKNEANIPGVQACLGAGLKYERLTRRSHSCLVCKIDCPLLFSLKGWQPSCSSFKSGKLNNASQREILCKIGRYPEIFFYPIPDSADCTWTRWSGRESYHISIVTSSPSP